MTKTYTGEPMAPDHKLGGIYAIMDRHGMLPDDWACIRCAKPLNADGNHPAELYAGTWNGLCYGCTSAGAYVAATSSLDGCRRVSWPPHCPSWRRDREDHWAYEDCQTCGGMGIELPAYRGSNSGGQYCRPCLARYSAHPQRAGWSRWSERVMRSCQASFERAWDYQAGVPKRCTGKRRAGLREAYAGPDREHQTPEFAQLKADYTAGYKRIRALVSGCFEHDTWTDVTEDPEAWWAGYCRWRKLDPATGQPLGPPEPEPDPREARVRLLRSLTWERAGELYRRGDISQVEYEAFGYAWRRGAYRYSSTAAGMEHPVDAAARELGNLIMGDKAPGTCPCSAGENCRR
jgi:hypothetical protein